MSKRNALPLETTMWMTSIPVPTTIPTATPISPKSSPSTITMALTCVRVVPAARNTLYLRRPHASNNHQSPAGSKHVGGLTREPQGAGAACDSKESFRTPNY